MASRPRCEADLVVPDWAGKGVPCRTRGPAPRTRANATRPVPGPTDYVSNEAMSNNDRLQTHRRDEPPAPLIYLRHRHIEPLEIGRGDRIDSVHGLDDCQGLLATAVHAHGQMDRRRERAGRLGIAMVSHGRDDRFGQTPGLAQQMAGLVVVHATPRAQTGDEGTGPMRVIVECPVGLIGQAVREQQQTEVVEEPGGIGQSGIDPGQGGRHPARQFGHGEGVDPEADPFERRALEFVTAVTDRDGDTDALDDIESETAAGHADRHDLDPR